MAELTSELADRIDTGINGSTEELQFTVRPGRMPQVKVTDGRGIVTYRAMGLAQFLSMLDRSTVVEQLRREDTRETRLPELPPRTLLARVTETPASIVYDVTGWIAPKKRAVILQETDDDRDRQESVHEVAFPAVVWRVSMDDEGSVRDARIAIAGQGVPVRVDAPIYRYPLSNVNMYGYGVSSICWPTMERDGWRLKDAPDIIERFFSVPNNGDYYGLSKSHNAPAEGYREFLELCERKGVIRHEWLIPMNMTVQDLHDTDD